MTSLMKVLAAWHAARDESTQAFLVLLVYPTLGAWLLGGLLVVTGWLWLAEGLMWLWILWVVMLCAVLPNGVFAPRGGYGRPPGPRPDPIPPPPRDE